MKLSKPEDRVYKVFKGWFQSETPFVGYGSHLLRDQDDFIALSPAIGDDTLSRSLRNLVGTYLSVSSIVYIPSFIRWRFLSLDTNTLEEGVEGQRNRESKILLSKTCLTSSHSHNSHRRFSSNSSGHSRSLPHQERDSPTSNDRRLHQRICSKSSPHDGWETDRYHPRNSCMRGCLGSIRCIRK